jgi:hypothetical protein
VVALTAACSGPADGPSCPTLSTSCPSSGAPSWSNEVQPIIRRSCYPCHAQGGSGALEGHDYQTYAGVAMVSTTAETDILNCKMPQAGGDQPLSAADAQTLVSWFACGHPNN